MAKRVLIIKLGYSETLVNEQGFTPSLGDVFRHTVLLHRYVDDHVTWLTSESALPLLEDNPFINELLVYSPATAEELKARDFDEVLCLEKAPTICQLAKSIKARKKLGFDWNGGGVQAHPLAQSALDIANGKDHFLPIQALLYQMVGDYWRGEDYILGYKPKPHPTYDVGLNYRVGSKWPTKSWPLKHWQKLEKLLQSAGLTVSWQEGEQDIAHYMDWINASRMIITCDSLGMHLSVAMQKKVLVLFGPTSSEGIYLYGRGKIVRAESACPHAPCMLAQCPIEALCMSSIKAEEVFKITKNMLGMTQTRLDEEKRKTGPIKLELVPVS